jgi:hypothetical protein
VHDQADHAEHETEEFDERIAYAIEYYLGVKLTVWSDGFTEERPGRFKRVAFDKMVGVAVVD